MSAPEQAPPKKGRVITFYSYKGGTGRTMLLANVAWILASNGKRVLVVDWDLEAPGLHRYYRPFLDDPELLSSPGLIDLVTDDAVAAMTAAKEGEPQPDPDRDASILPFASSLRWSFEKPGTIDFVPAGKQGPTYAARVNSFNWQNYYDRLGGGAFLDAVRAGMIEEYDYVLIDSRTGVSDTAGICTVQLPDAIVVCFTLNNQSIEGASAIARSVLEQRKDPNFPVFPVPTRVEDGEKRKLDRARDHARTAFRDLIAHVERSKIEQYWSRVEVPYKIYYAYEEVLATFGDRPEQLNSLLASAERLTGYLTRGEVTRLVPPGEADRRRVLGEFERTQKKKQEEEEEKEGRRAETPVPPPPVPPPPGRPMGEAPSERPVSSWRRWAIGGVMALGAVGLVAAGRFSHMLAGGPPPAPSGTASVDSDAGVAGDPPPASATPSAIVAAFDPQKDPVDQVALLRSLPESPPPPQNVVDAASALAKGPLPIAVLRGHTQDISAARFAEGGTRIVTASYDGTVRVWHSDGSGEARTLDWGSNTERRVMSLAVAPGLAAAGTEDGEVCIWMIRDGDTFSFPLQHVEKRRGLVRFNGDGSIFVRAFEYGQVHVWKVERYEKSFAPEKTGVLFSAGAVQDVELNADGSTLARSPDKVTVWKQVKASTAPDMSLRAGPDWSDKGDIVAALSRHGDAIAVAGADGILRVWHEAAGVLDKPPRELKHSGAAITALAVDGDRCAFGTADGGVYLWRKRAPEAKDAKPGDPAPVLLGQHKGRVSSVFFGNDGGSLVSAGVDGVARVFTLGGDGGGQPLVLGKEGGPAIGNAFISDDGALVATVVGRIAQVWRLKPAAPATAGWASTRSYLRSSSSVELSDDRKREIMAPTRPAQPPQQRQH